MYTQTYLLSVKHPHLHCTTSAQCAHTIPQVPWCCHAASFTEESLIFFLMDSAVGGRTEIVSIDFIFGRLCSGHLVLQHTLLSLSVFLSHTHHQSLLSHLHASLILVQWLACAILSLLFFFQWFGIFCFMSAMFLYGLSIAHPSFSHLPFLLPFHSSAYCFLSIFTCLLFSSNLYSYFSHLFFSMSLSLSSIPPSSLFHSISL